MRFRTILVALLAVTALTAVAATSAQAAPHWKIEGEAWSEEESVSAEEHPGKPIVIHLKLLGLNITVTATRTSCIGCKKKKGGVKGSGKHKLTEVTVDINEVAAPKCSVNGGTIESEPLVDNLVMDGENIIDKVEPAAGATGKIATLTFSGSECPVNEASVPLTGTVCGLAQHTNASSSFESNKTVETGSTEVLRSPQTLVFSAANQTTGGCSLLAGKQEAQTTKSIDIKLAGPNTGKPWGAGE